MAASSRRHHFVARPGVCHALAGLLVAHFQQHRQQIESTFIGFLRLLRDELRTTPSMYPAGADKRRLRGVGICYGKA
jgi:hypothetical protein